MVGCCAAALTILLWSCPVKEGVSVRCCYLFTDIVSAVFGVCAACSGRQKPRDRRPGHGHQLAGGKLLAVVRLLQP